MRSATVRDRDVHTEPIPYLGGIAMLGGSRPPTWSRASCRSSRAATRFVFQDAGVVLAAGALVCAVGVLDDIFDLDALTKFGGQVLAASLLVAFGVRFYYFPGFDGSSQFILDPAQGALLSVVVVIATINAVNFVDGLDGLAAGVVGIGAVAFFVFCYFLSSENELTLATTGALLTASLAGACAGFLPHNFHPARLFMGDSGSMLIGLVLSASALTVTGQFAGNEISSDGNNCLVTVLPVLLPASLLMVPGGRPRCWRSYAVPAPAGRPSHPTSSTSTTDCSRSATRSGERSTSCGCGRRSSPGDRCSSACTADGRRGSGLAAAFVLVAGDDLRAPDHPQAGGQPDRFERSSETL